MSKSRRNWSPREDAVLQRHVELAGGNPRDWTTIAAALPGRTNKDCRKRWHNSLISRFSKGPWEADEDDRLASAVEQLGPQWSVITKQVMTRSADQCAKRWSQALDPSLDRSRWSQQECATLLEAVKVHGKAWKLIQKKHFPGRAANNVKNSYIALMKKDANHSVDEDSDMSSLCDRADSISRIDVTPPDQSHQGRASSLSDAHSPADFTDLSVPSNLEDPLVDPASEMQYNFDLDLLTYLGEEDFVTPHHNISQAGDLYRIDAGSSSSSAQAASSSLELSTRAVAATSSRIGRRSHGDVMMVAADQDGSGGRGGEMVVSGENFAAQQPHLLPMDLSSPQSVSNSGYSTSSSKLVVEIENPSSDIVKEVMGMLMNSKAPFRSAMQYNAPSSPE